jgi:hypothetical protein
MPNLSLLFCLFPLKEKITPEAITAKAINEMVLNMALVFNNLKNISLL